MNPRRAFLPAALLLASSPAWAQEAALRLGSPVQADDPDKVGLTLVQRFSAPDGDLGGAGGDYGDFLDAGYGLSVEADYLLSDGSSGWRFGPYLSMGWDWFGGKEDRLQGVLLEADTTTVFSSLIGVKGAYQVDRRLFLELRGGVGLSHWRSTDAELPGGLASVELFESTTTICAEGGFRAGFLLGKLLLLDFGAGLRVRGGPEEGDVDLSPGTMIQYFMDVGFGFRF